MSSRRAAIVAAVGATLVALMIRESGLNPFLGFTITGITTGAIYAIAATGLVVTYTTSGIFNFAHGAMGMVSAFLYWELIENRGWPLFPALLFVLLVVAPLFGAVVERTLLRNLAGAAVGTTMVVTLGLMVGLIGLGQAIWRAEGRDLTGFFEGKSFELAGLVVTYDEVAVVVIAAVVAVLLRLLFYNTRTGIAMRAVVDDRGLAALNGARPARISQLSWMLGSFLAGLSGILLAPLLQLDVLLLTLLVVNAYAAAMMGRLRSLPMTFAGGVLLGVVEAYVIGYSSSITNVAPFTEPIIQGLRPSIPTIFLFAILLTMPGARLRVGRLVGKSAPRVPNAREAGLAAVAFVAAAWLLSPLMSDYTLSNGSKALSLGIIMLTLVLLTGYGGQISLCQLSFVGLGAFAMGKVGADGTVVGLVVAALLAGAVGAIVALPSLRLQGLYLALSTMAFALLMEKMFFNQGRVFPGGNLRVGRLDLPGVSFDGDQAYFVLLAVVFAGYGAFVLWLRRGPFGRLLAAMRDSPVACATLGLDLTRTKLAVFSLSAAMAGVAGALYGGLQTSVGEFDFIAFLSLPLLLMAVIGGITTVSGALIGGIVYGAMLPVVRERYPAYAGLVYAIIGLGAISLGRNPDGLAAMAASALRRLFPSRDREARPAEPELVPDAREVPPVAAPAR